jgi:hypothetical protein
VIIGSSPGLLKGVSGGQRDLGYFTASQVNAGEDNDPSSCGSWA